MTAFVTQYLRPVAIAKGGTLVHLPTPYMRQVAKWQILFTFLQTSKQLHFFRKKVNK